MLWSAHPSDGVLQGEAGTRLWRSWGLGPPPMGGQRLSDHLSRCAWPHLRVAVSDPIPLILGLGATTRVGPEAVRPSLEMCLASPRVAVSDPIPLILGLGATTRVGPEAVRPSLEMCLASPPRRR